MKTKWISFVVTFSFLIGFTSAMAAETRYPTKPIEIISGQPGGLEVVENTGQEILDLAQEMNERLDGTFNCLEEDEELQKIFHSLIPPNHPCYGTTVRIGAKFLRENKELLI